MRNFIKQIPLIGSTAKWMKSKLFPSQSFTNSQEYWENRYQKGGNSGAGSYNHLAEFKADIINKFVSTHQIDSVIDFGFGDGNQLEYFQFKSYLGFDISDIQVEKLRQKYKDQKHFQFKHINELNDQKADLTMSLDVIYHLIEDETFENYMSQLFASSNRFVIIYSNDYEESNNYEPHVRLRKFSDWISLNRPDFQLIEHIPNKYPYKETDPNNTSISDFFIYKKIN